MTSGYQSLTVPFRKFSQEVIRGAGVIHARIVAILLRMSVRRGT